MGSAREGARIRETAQTQRAYGGAPLEARRDEQRERLVRGARDVFAERGYAAVSIEDIVRRARVSRTAFYMFFEGKDDCMLAVFWTGIDAVISALRDVSDSNLDAAAKVEAGVEAIVASFAADPVMARVLLIEAVGTSPRVEEARAEARVAFADIIREQMDGSGLWTGRDREEMSLVAIATMAGIAETVGLLVAEGRIGDWRKVLPALQRFALRALAPEVGPA